MHPSFLIPRLESVVGYEKTIPSYVFPRKVRNSIAQDDNPIILQSYLSMYMHNAYPPIANITR